MFHRITSHRVPALFSHSLISLLHVDNPVLNACILTKCLFSCLSMSVAHSVQGGLFPSTGPFLPLLFAALGFLMCLHVAGCSAGHPWDWGLRRVSGHRRRLPWSLWTVRSRVHLSVCVGTSAAGARYQGTGSSRSGDGVRKGLRELLRPLEWESLASCWSCHLLRVEAGLSYPLCVSVSKPGWGKYMPTVLIHLGCCHWIPEIDWPINNRNYCSQLWGPGRSGCPCQHFCVWWEPTSWVINMAFSLCPPMTSGARKLPEVPFIRALILFTMGLHSWPNPLPKASPLHSITLRMTF